MKKPLKMAKMCAVSRLERQFATLYLFHAPTGVGGETHFYGQNDFMDIWACQEYSQGMDSAMIPGAVVASRQCSSSDHFSRRTSGQIQINKRSSGYDSVPSDKCYARSPQSEIRVKFLACQFQKTGEKRAEYFRPSMPRQNCRKKFHINSSRQDLFFVIPQDLNQTFFHCDTLGVGGGPNKCQDSQSVQNCIRRVRKVFSGVWGKKSKGRRGVGRGRR